MVEGVECGAAFVDCLAHGPLEEGEEQVVFALEVQVHGAGGDIGARIRAARYANVLQTLGGARPR